MHVLMDMDDVLIKSSYINSEDKKSFLWMEHIEEELGVEKKTLPLLFNDDWENVILGKKTIHQQVEEYLQRINSKLSPSEFISYWIEHDSSLNESVFHWAQEKHRQGWKFYIGANQENHRVNEIIKKYSNEFLIFDKIYTSATLGVKKNNPIFFQTVLNDLKLEPQDLLFIDDSVNNVKTASDLGIHVFLYKGEIPKNFLNFSLSSNS